MTGEKKKIDSRKIIYRKLRQPNNNKKNITKMAILAVLMTAFLLVSPGICTGIDISAAPDPKIPVERDPDTRLNEQDSGGTEIFEESEVWPPKLQSDPSGISGQLTYTYHI